MHKGRTVSTKATSKSSAMTADRAAYTAALTAALVALVAAIALCAAVAARWLSRDDATAGDDGTPRWVAPGKTKATTSDGIATVARVAIDAGGSEQQQALNSHLGEVGLILQISIAEQDRAALAGPQGVEHLAQSMRSRLDDYLDQQSLRPVRQVAVEDLVFYKP
jgi:flagellar basal body-associated protein FliL